MSIKIKRSFGFTLAEVLITLGIIGIVALLVIPHTIIKYEKLKTVSLVKETFSRLTNAFERSSFDEGIIDHAPLSFFVGDDTQNLTNNFAKYFYGIYSFPAGCEGHSFLNPDEEYPKYFNNTDIHGSSWWGNYPSQCAPQESLPSGVGISFFDLFGDCIPNSNECARVFIDVNQRKPPNVMGKDIFEFVVTYRGVYPRGSSKDPTMTTVDDCVPGGLGLTCANKLLSEDAINYY